MKIEFDDDKNQANIAKHGVSLAAVEDFAFDTAVEVPDTRRDYGEKRKIALGHIEARLHVLVFTMRGRTMRVISLRRANLEERKRYDEQTQKA